MYTQQQINNIALFFTIIIIVISLLFAIVTIIAMWKIFEKAKQPGWASLIPIYNTIVLLKICQRPWWWIFLLFIPLVNFVIMIVVFSDLARVFGKDTAFAVGLILLTPIFLLILAFDNSQYIGTSQITPNRNY